MKLFIGKGIYNEENFDKSSIQIYKNDSMNSCDMIILDFLHSKYVNIRLPYDICESNFNEDVTINNVKLRKMKDGYMVLRTRGCRDSGVYLLLRSTEFLANNIYVDYSKKDKIRTLNFKKIVDRLDSYYTNIYLIKLELKEDSSISIIMASSNSSFSSKEYIIHNSNGEYNIESTNDTYINFDSGILENYVLLSKVVV